MLANSAPFFAGIMSISKTILDAGDTTQLVKKYDEVSIEYTGTNWHVKSQTLRLTAFRVDI